MTTITKCLTGWLQILLLCAFSSLALANDVDQQIGQLRADIDVIERDISALEQNLLFPPLTRVTVYLSLAGDADYTLRSVSLRIDGREQSFHVYEPDEIAALRLGGVQTLWEGNVALGKRQLTARFVGVDRKGELVKGEAQLDFEKSLKGRALELQVLGGGKTAFAVKDWGVK